MKEHPIQKPPQKEHDKHNFSPRSMFLSYQVRLLRFLRKSSKPAAIAAIAEPTIGTV